MGARGTRNADLAAGGGASRRGAPTGSISPVYTAASSLKRQGPPREMMTPRTPGRAWRRRAIPNGTATRRILSHVGTTSNRPLLAYLQIALRLFEALRTFDRAASRAELERESGLDYDQVHKALRTLDRHQVLVKSIDGKRAALYRLIEGAGQPVTARGRYRRDDEHRRRMSAAVCTAQQAAPPPVAGNRSAAARIIVRGVLDTRHKPGEVFDVCTLAELWKPS